MKNKRLLYFNFLCYIAGSFLFSLGIYSFAEGANIAPGGVSGIAVMVKYACGFPIGVFTLIFNIPLLFIASRQISPSFVFKTLCVLIINSIVLDCIISKYAIQYIGDRLMACIFSGVLTGAGLALIFRCGASTGGTDIICILIEKKYPHVQIGTAIMAVDAVIILISAVVFKNIESAMFSAVCVFVQIKVIDYILYGTDKCRQVLVISENSDLICSKIIGKLNRSATVFSATGAFSKKSVRVILCVIRRQEFAQLKEIVLTEDENAFMVICETTQIVGKGFKGDK